MASRVLDKAEWHSYFDKLAKVVQAKQTHIEVIGPAMGDQVLAKSVPALPTSRPPISWKLRSKASIISFATPSGSRSRKMEISCNRLK